MTQAWRVFGDQQEEKKTTLMTRSDTGR